MNYCNLEENMNLSYDIQKIEHEKKQFLDLLLLADEQEDMIDRYLEQGEMYALYDDGLKCVAVVEPLNNNECELKNIATYQQYQGRGYGRAMIQYLVNQYKESHKTMLVGTGDSPMILGFYQNCGFRLSHRVKNFFVDNYSNPIIENGIQLIDMVYLRMDLY